MLLGIGAWEKLLKQNGGTVGNIYIYMYAYFVILIVGNVVNWNGVVWAKWG